MRYDEVYNHVKQVGTVKKSSFLPSALQGPMASPSSKQQGKHSFMNSSSSPPHVFRNDNLLNATKPFGGVKIKREYNEVRPEIYLLSEIKEEVDIWEDGDSVLNAHETNSDQTESEPPVAQNIQDNSQEVYSTTNETSVSAEQTSVDEQTLPHPEQTSVDVQTLPQSDSILCPICGIFLHKSIQWQHMQRTHSKKYHIIKRLCPTCGVFVNSNRLKEHMVTHSNIREFKCCNCGETFKYKHVRDRHSRDYCPNKK